MPEHQGPRRYAYVKILVAGKDLTSRFSPYLISVQVISVMGAQDRCNIELDDRNAELIIPGDSARIQVVMGWHHEGPRVINVGASMDAFKMGSYNEATWGGPGAEEVFDGHLANCESGFGRKGGGRRLWLECEGGSPKGTAKEQQSDSVGEGKKRDSEAATDEGGAAPDLAGAAGGSLAGKLVGGALGAVAGAIGGPIGAAAGAALGATIGSGVGGGTPTPKPGSPEAIAAAAQAAAAADPPISPEGFVTSQIGDKNAPPDAPGTFSEGKISLQEAATKFFGKAGMTIKLSPKMMAVRRNYWNIQNESVQAWGEKIARELGGHFKIKGNIATIVGKNEGVNADGEKMPNIEAIWGVNLIGWRIKPFISRPEYGSAASRYFDLDEGVWKQTKESIEAQFPYGQALATAFTLASEVDKNVAGQKVEGNAEQSKWEKGTGWCLINGDPRAKADSTITIMGARPGINGTYTAEEVEHNYQRGVGYTTRIVVKAPNPTGAGGGFGNDPGRPQPRSLSNPAPLPDAEAPDGVAEFLKGLAIGTEEGRIEGRFKAGFISRAEADKLIAQIRRRRLSAEEQARIKRYDEERRQGYAQ